MYWSKKKSAAAGHGQSCPPGRLQRPDQLLHLSDRITIECVVDPAPNLSVLDDSGVPECLEMKRKPGLRRVECIGEIAYALFPTQQALNDLQSRLVRERVKK